METKTGRQAAALRTRDEIMLYRFAVVVLLLSLFTAAPLLAISGSRGTPLGGIGTGYVKFDARTGDFAASSRIPPAAGDMQCEFPDRMSNSSGFHFFAGGQGVLKATTASDDAKCPLYMADFGKVNNVRFFLRAFAPVVPGDNALNMQLATSPCAYLEITASNEGDSATEVAVALEFTNASTGVSGLLGGADEGEIDSSDGLHAVFFPTRTFSDVPTNPENTGNACILAGCDRDDATFSAGSPGEFQSTGTLSPTGGTCVAAKYRLAPNDSVRIRFVMAWWRTFISGTDRYGSGKNDDDNYYYHNYYQTSREAAVFGMRHFDRVKDGIESLVFRVMGSNFPEWYKERLLNNTYPLIHNSIWTKDGRAAFWEGNYGIIGTIDQGQHAAVWYTLNWPKNQYRELAYWLKSARQEPDQTGQIHHDFNIAPGLTFDPPESRFLAPWDNWDRDDYWHQTNTSEWSDLNTMALFKAYELMLATGDLDSMKLYYPLILRTAERLLQQSPEKDGYLPIRSKSTYDTEKYGTPQYATGIALTAFLAMEGIAQFVGDTVTARKFRGWYTEARREFRTRMFNSNFCTGRNFAEGDVAGYSWANYLCLEPVMDADIINEGCRRLWGLYTASASTVQEKLGRWHFYTCDHWGGAEIARGTPDTAMMIFKWDYDYYHTVRKDMVFWQDLWGDLGRYASYMTAPSVWRSYLQMTGYLLDNANKRLWLRPRIPSVMANRIVDAPLPNPYGWGNLYYDGNEAEAPGETEKRTQQLFVTFDSLVTVKEVVLNNNTMVDNPFVIVTLGETGIHDFACTTEGAAPEKNMKIAFTEPLQIGPSGMRIDVYTGEVGVVHSSRTPYGPALSIHTSSIAAGRPISFTTDIPGTVTLDLLTIGGKKTGTLLRRSFPSPGKQTFIWNGATLEGGTTTPSVMVLRLRSPSGSVSRLVSTVNN